MKAQITHKHIGIVFLVVLFGGFAQAAVINVPADFGTIQGAISDAGTVNGDEIVVAAGTYFEVIDFIGKSITVRSASGDPNDTIIDATGYGLPVVRCVNGEDPNTVLEGFTLTGGTGDTSYYGAGNPLGGGMYNSYSSPTVTNCTFIENSAFRGGGMYNRYGSPTVSYCTFIDNTVTNSGGGMHNAYDASPTVTDCIFVGNSAGWAAGGMYNTYNYPTVTDCSFIGNTAVSSDGGGMYNDNSFFVTVTNCTFVGNSTASLGGGIVSFFGNNMTLTNCIFSGNTAGLGGGIASFFGNNMTVTNCTFGGNTATVDGGGMYDGSSILTVANCIFWENSDAGGMDESAQIFTGGGAVVNYSNIQGGWTGAGGTGNLNADPNFADALGADNTIGTVDDDFRLLSPSSPCIDAGDISVVTESTDRDGNPRLIDDPNTPDTGTGVCPFKPVDMGAYEFFIDDDEDNDTISNACDTCPGFDDLIDTDNDGYPNDCDVCEGFDDDATLEEFFNSGGTDIDDDGLPDVCDQCILLGDINCDGFVDNFDLGIMAMHWLESTP